jgi:hypothetical protein
MSPQTQSLTFKWFAGVLLAVLLAAGGAWASNVNKQLDRSQDVLRSQAERDAWMEAKLEAIDQRTMRIEALLDQPPANR